MSRIKSHFSLLLIERSISPRVHDLVLTLLRDAELSPRIIITESTVYDEAGAMMAASGKGVVLAVGKNPCHPSFAARLVALKLREPGATLEVHVAWRRGETSSTILDFIETTKQGFSAVLVFVAKGLHSENFVTFRFQALMPPEQT